MKGAEVTGLTFFALLAFMIVSIGPSFAAGSRMLAGAPALAAPSASADHSLPSLPSHLTASEGDADTPLGVSITTQNLVVVQRPVAAGSADGCSDQSTRWATGGSDRFIGRFSEPLIDSRLAPGYRGGTSAENELSCEAR
jgi:hypothetical protein